MLLTTCLTTAPLETNLFKSLFNCRRLVFEKLLNISELFTRPLAAINPRILSRFDPAAGLISESFNKRISFSSASQVFQSHAPLALIAFRSARILSVSFIAGDFPKVVI